MSHPSQNNPYLCLIWAVLFAVVASLIAFFMLGTCIQAFTGPRPLSEEELLGLREPPGTNYVTFRATGPVEDTGLRYGKKGNEGTKYLLTKTGDRALLISARIDNNGPEFTGRIETISGTEQEVAGRLQGQGRLLPVYLQTVRSIWFDTIVSLVFIVLGAALAVWMACRGVYFLKQPKPSDDAPDAEDNEPPPAFRKGGRGANPDERMQSKPPRRSDEDY